MLGKPSSTSCGVNPIRQSECPARVKIALVAVERDVDFEAIDPFLVVGPDHRQGRAEGELASEAFPQDAGG